jgi:hypothetical protein
VGDEVPRMGVRLSVAHHNMGMLLDDPAGRKIMKRVASDDNRHYLFYRDVADAAFQIDPSGRESVLEYIQRVGDAGRRTAARKETDAAM